MSNTEVLRGWEERVISTEKGNRVVHYILRDNTGSSVLAVVGMEKSMRHLTYHVSPDYLRAFGSTSMIHAQTRWKSRKDVVEWLRSIVYSNGPLFANPIHKFIVQKPRPQFQFKTNENVEILCQDSGLRGCWFRCKVLHSTVNHLKVQYYDLFDADGPRKNLEECVSTTKTVNGDKLGMRCVGRLRIRPWPSEDSSNPKFQEGTAVDAWWADGWWEGVLVGQQISEENKFHVYFPGEEKLMTVDRKNLRISRDWMYGMWMDINPNPNIMSICSTLFRPMSKQSQLPVLAEANSSDVKTSTTLLLEDSKDVAESSSKPGNNLIEVKEYNFKKRLMIRYGLQKV